MIGIDDDKIVYVPFAKAIKNDKPIDRELVIITTIADQAKRARAEKICITAGIDFIKNRAERKCGKCFLNVLKDAVAAVDAQ